MIYKITQEQNLLLTLVIVQNKRDIKEHYNSNLIVTFNKHTSVDCILYSMLLSVTIIDNREFSMVTIKIILSILVIDKK